MVKKKLVKAEKIKALDITQQLIDRKELLMKEIDVLNTNILELKKDSIGLKILNVETVYLTH